MRGVLFFLVGFLFLGSVGIKGQVTFGPEKIVTNAQYVYSIHDADLNNDGSIDIVTANWGSDMITWCKNDGNGNLHNPSIISTEVDGPRSVFPADLDGDGDIDVLSASWDDDKIAWYENDGSGNFGTQNIISDDFKDATFVSAADLDGDGDIDVVASSFSEQLAWFFNDGSGSFDNQQTINVGSSLIYTVDMNNDDKIDILVRPSCGVRFYENDGNGNFDTPTYIPSDGCPRTIFPTDIDGDGDIDVVVGSFESSSWVQTSKVYWSKNDGNGNFVENILISLEIDDVQSVYSADLDSDGDMDVLSASSDDDKVAWYENNGSGEFGSQNIISNFDTPYFVYSSDLDNDGDMDILLGHSAFSKSLVYHKNTYEIKNNIIAFVFQDNNKNGLYEENEKPLFNKQTVIQPSSNGTFTNLEGYTHFSVNKGEYQLTYQPNPLWELTTTPSTYDIVIDDNSELPIHYFGFSPTRLFSRVEPHLNSSPTRCSTTSNYYLHYSNTGTTIANGTITLEVDELMELVVAYPEPNEIEGNTLTWHFSELYPSFENKIQLQFQMPDFNSIGEILETQATVQLFNENGVALYPKTTDYNSEVQCAYDPNDKLVRSNLLGQSEFAYLTDTILYTVRFQNTGNDTAFNIRIEDTLDKKLDWTTFHPITASHDYRTELNRETGLVTFYFDGIMLPDSTTNEPESHGFVMFGIASLVDLQDKIEVDNTASIFFDFNPPIITNTATLTLIEQVETNIETLNSDYSIRVFPNPFSDYTTIEVNGLSAKGDYRLEVMDILGRKVRELMVEEGKVRLERRDLERGLYLVRVLTDENRVLGSGKVLAE